MNIFMNWISQIIIVIILAAIVDLVIPTSKLQKYIRFVVGMILMLVFLQPLFYIFKTDLKTELDRAIEQFTSIPNNDPEIENSSNLQKSEIETAKHAYIQEQMAVQLEQTTREDLANLYGAEITDIEFQEAETEIGVKDEQKAPYSEVVVKMKMLKEQKGAVKEIDEITINQEAKPVVADVIDDESVMNLLIEKWGIDEQELKIVWEGETT